MNKIMVNKTKQHYIVILIAVTLAVLFFINKYSHTPKKDNLYISKKHGTIIDLINNGRGYYFLVLANKYKVDTLYLSLGYEVKNKYIAIGDSISKSENNKVFFIYRKKSNSYMLNYELTYY